MFRFIKYRVSGCFGSTYFFPSLMNDGILFNQLANLQSKYYYMNGAENLRGQVQWEYFLRFLKLSPETPGRQYPFTGFVYDSILSIRREILWPLIRNSNFPANFPPRTYPSGDTIRFVDDDGMKKLGREQGWEAWFLLCQNYIR